MCRILVGKNLPLNRKQLQEHIEYLIEDAGGDGAGFAYRGEVDDELVSVKSAKWNDGVHLTNTYLSFSKKSIVPVMLHLRKASHGSTNSLNNHPIPLENKRWKEIDKDNEVYLSTARAYLIHNGTVTLDKVRRWRRELVLSGSYDVKDLRPSMTDTMILAAIVAKYGEEMLAYNYAGYGLIMTMDKEGHVEIVKTTSRDLYLVYWQENSWMVTSNLELGFARELVKNGATIVDIPSIYTDLEYLFNTISDRGMTDIEINREFKSKNSSSTYGVGGQYGYAVYNNNKQKGKNNNVKRKKSNNEEANNHALTTPIHSTLKARRWIINNGDIVPYETA